MKTETKTEQTNESVLSVYELPENKVMSKEEQIKKFHKLCSDYNVPFDLLDFESLVDNTLNFSENERAIFPLIETLSGSQSQEDKIKSDFKTKKKTIRNEKEEQSKIELEGFKLEEENAKEQFENSIEKIKFKTTDTLDEAFHITKQLIKTIINSKNINGLILRGESGLGKSYTCLKVFKELNLKLGIDYDMLNSYATPLELYQFLHKNKDNKIILLDDIMKIFENELNIGILLSALWGEGERKVSYHTTSSKLKVPQDFIFNSKIIWCLNKIPDELQSIKSRCYFYELEFSYEDKIRLLYELAKIKKIPFEVVDFIKTNSDELTPELDFRLLLKIYDVYLNNKKEWKEISSALLKVDNKIKLLKEILKKSATMKQAEMEWCNTTGYSRSQFFRLKSKVSKCHQF